MANSVVQEIVDREIRKPGDLLSPSSVNTFLDCSAKWAYRAIHRLPDPSNGARVRGKAVHALISHYFKQAMEGDAPRLDQLQEPWDAIWDRESDDAVFAADENIEDLKASGAALAAKYLTDGAPNVDPAMVDVAVTGEIAGVPVRGYIDLIDISGRIIDFKTASRKPSGVSADYALQLASYVQLLPEASGNVRLDTVVSTKVPQLVQIEYQISQADRQLTERIYPRVQAAMQSGHYMPNRGSMRCSKRYCSFWEACQDEFGGHIQ
jgi:putative RecB family exonuclease